MENIMQNTFCSCVELRYMRVRPTISSIHGHVDNLFLSTMFLEILSRTFSLITGATISHRLLKHLTVHFKK
jgi:hypothetical protein